MRCWNLLLAEGGHIELAFSSEESLNRFYGSFTQSQTFIFHSFTYPLYLLPAIPSPLPIFDLCVANNMRLCIVSISHEEFMRIHGTRKLNNVTRSGMSSTLWGLWWSLYVSPTFALSWVICVLRFLIHVFIDSLP